MLVQVANLTPHLCQNLLGHLLSRVRIYIQKPLSPWLLLLGLRLKAAVQNLGSRIQYAQPLLVALVLWCQSGDLLLLLDAVGLRFSGLGLQCSQQLGILFSSESVLSIEDV